MDKNETEPDEKIVVRIDKKDILNNFLKDFIRECVWKTNGIVFGGYVKNMIFKDKKIPNDVDIFFRNKTDYNKFINFIDIHMRESIISYSTGIVSVGRDCDNNQMDDNYSTFNNIYNHKKIIFKIFTIPYQSEYNINFVFDVIFPRETINFGLVCPDLLGNSLQIYGDINEYEQDSFNNLRVNVSVYQQLMNSMDEEMSRAEHYIFMTTIPMRIIKLKSTNEDYILDTTKKISDKVILFKRLLKHLKNKIIIKNCNFIGTDDIDTNECCCICQDNKTEFKFFHTTSKNKTVFTYYHFHCFIEYLRNNEQKEDFYDVNNEQNLVFKCPNRNTIVVKYEKINLYKALSNIKI